ncbi:MAG TPA: iron-sulfur cluster assembly protein [Conexibacter sp.]|nr:iron-sulfur cluster assembly protein [Conexibacter sp.]
MPAPAPSPQQLDRPALERAVEAALGTVLDPCSIAAANPLSLPDMGLIQRWDYDPATRMLSVVLIVTSPACFLVEDMIDGIRRSLEGLDAVDAVHVEVDAAARWTPDMVSPAGQASLERRRAHARRRLGLRPQQWREASPGAATRARSTAAPRPAAS